jgi:hypothetical protein
MNQVVSKVGIHCVGPARTGYGAFLQTINNAGRMLSIVKCRDDFGAIDEPLALWPDVLTVGAKTEWDDAGYDVTQAYNRIMAAASQKPGIKYWEYLNERNGDWVQQADLYIALLPMLRAAGLRLCMFNCASGTPEYPGIDDTGYREIKRACKFALDGGYDALLGLHEYQSDGGTTGRYESLADYLEDYRALIPIAITEYGYETYHGTAQHMAMLEQNDPMYMRDPRVIGCADWTLGGGGWAGSNYQRDLPAMADYIATVAPVVVPPIDPPPDPVAESYDGACVGANESIIDANGDEWRLDSTVPRNPDAGYPVLYNGAQYHGGQAEMIMYSSRDVLVINTRFEVYRAVPNAPWWVRVDYEPVKVGVL